MKTKTSELKREKEAEKKSNIDQFLKGSTKRNNDSVSNNSQTISKTGINGNNQLGDKYH